MDENSRRDGAHETVTSGNIGSGVGGGGGSTFKKSRYDDHHDAAVVRRGDSPNHCGSCSAALIADCVALCCCPCAVVNLLTLALVKVPWKIGRRCLGLGKRRRKSKRKCEDYSIEKSGSLIGGGAEDGIDGIVEILAEFDGEGEMYAAEKVWLELYEVGRLGFGRVSFTGVEFES